MSEQLGSSRAIRRKLCGNFAFLQNFHTRKLGEKLVFCAEPNTHIASKIHEVYLDYYFKLPLLELLSHFRYIFFPLKFFHFHILSTLSPDHVYIRFAFYHKSPYHVYVRLNIKDHSFLNLCSMQLKIVKHA